MRAELVLMGKRLDMASQLRRRTLVVSIYAALAALMTGLWLLDHWHVTGVYMLFATMLVNRLFLGGQYFGGLVKPFNNKAPRRYAEPPLLVLLKFGLYPVPEPENHYRNDERELHQRDHAHYIAYQSLAVVLAVVWLLTNWKMHEPRILAWAPVSADLLLYGFVLAAIIAAFTLPQAILLWTEPDMDEESA